MITVYLIAYNDELLLPYAIRHYRGRFNGCRIVVYDNFSKDKTAAIASSLDCEVKYFYTGDKLDDQAILNVKNTCWKEAKTNWVIVCDVDEWLDIRPRDLLWDNYSIVSSGFIEMVGMSNDIDIPGMRYGVFNHQARKMLCFDKSRISDIHYSYGCHEAMPIGDIEFSNHLFNVYHMKWLSPAYVIERNKAHGPRLSAENLRKGLSFHLQFHARQTINRFKQLRKSAIMIP